MAVLHSLLGDHMNAIELFATHYLTLLGTWMLMLVVTLVAYEMYYPQRNHLKHLTGWDGQDWSWKGASLVLFYLTFGWAEVAADILVTIAKAARLLYARVKHYPQLALELCRFLIGFCLFAIGLFVLWMILFSYDITEWVLYGETKTRAEFENYWGSA